MNFAIAAFADQSVAVIPTNWISEDNTCYWPPSSVGNRINKAVRQREDPTKESWILQHNVRILERYDSYENARSHLKSAEDTSNLDSCDDKSNESNKNRKRKARKGEDIENELQLDDLTHNRNESQVQEVVALKSVVQKSSSAPVQNSSATVQNSLPPPLPSDLFKDNKDKPKSDEEKKKKIHEIFMKIQARKKLKAEHFKSKLKRFGTPQKGKSSLPAIRYRKNSKPRVLDQESPTVAQRQGESTPQVSDQQSAGLVQRQVESTPRVSGRQSANLDQRIVDSTPRNSRQDLTSSTCTQLQGDSTPRISTLETNERGSPRVLDFLLQKITKIDHQQQQMMNLLQYIADGIRSSGVLPQIDPPEGISLPLRRASDLRSCEQALELSREKTFQLTSYLGVIGGKDVRETTNRILVALFSNEFASTLNYCGRGNKQGIRNLRIISVVLDAVRRNPITRKATDKEIEMSIKLWLRGATDRVGGRRRREELQRQKNTHSEMQDDAADWMHSIDSNSDEY